MYSCEQTLVSRVDPREGAGVRVIFQAATEEPSVVLPTLFSSGILTCRLWFISRLRTYNYMYIYVLHVHVWTQLYYSCKFSTGGGKNKSGIFVELRMYVSCIVYGTFGDHFLSAHT